MVIPAPAVASAKSLGQWAERRLRLAILTGELPPGSRLAPTEISRAWDISATPLREAIHRLAAEGLIEEVRHRGARVRPMNVDDLRELYEFRLLIEPSALEKSLRASDDSHRAAMTEAHERWVRAANDPHLDELSVEEAHQAFHASLLARCPSSWLLTTIDTLSQHSARYRILAKYTGRGGVAAAAHEHAELLQASLDGDEPLAASLLRRHLERTLDSVAAAGLAAGREETSAGSDSP